MNALTAWLDAAQKRCDEATVGPWEANGSDVIRVVPDTNGDPEPELVAQAWRVDAEFIAHARTDLPAALAALRAVLDEHPGCEADTCLTIGAIATALGTTP